MARQKSANHTASQNGAQAGGTPRIDRRYVCFGMKLAQSKIHRWGVYATESIPAGKKVIEYTGEKISRRETKRRADASDLIYLFTLDPYWTLDGSVGGSGAEYINHSCEPNLVARILRGHILYVSRRKIRAGEELTVDYHFDKKVERVPCRCGAPKCRGTINLLE
ncbi:MAG TPA: SET domain-containing protein-lysine N-methyltransferase [Bryobacteraceae bacterium]|jgi:SET domain-containing protein